MSAIASFMVGKGHVVAGSDRAFDANPSHPAYRALLSQGICIVPQDGRGIDPTLQLLVISTAVETTQPEIVKASGLGIPIRSRPEVLADIVMGHRTIAVAGTSGKSTVSGMLAYLMKGLGLDPGFIGGGRVKEFRSERSVGNVLAGKSDYLVVEACESDGSIVQYRPEHSIVMNLDRDHHSVRETGEMFRRLAENTAGMIVINNDDPQLQRIDLRGTVSFSIDGASSFRAEHLALRDFSSEFSVSGQRFRLSLPGKYNIYNALACISTLAGMGIPMGEIAPLLPSFTGIDRRFDVHLREGRFLVVDDYAHNPHKIAALMESVRAVSDRVCYIFQPHGYTPTRMMKDDYIASISRSMRPSDHIIMLPIYYAGGTVHADVSSHDLAVGISAEGRSAEVVGSRSDILGRIDEWDAYVVFGARDETLSDFAREIASAIRKERMG